MLVVCAGCRPAIIQPGAPLRVSYTIGPKGRGKVEKWKDEKVECWNGGKMERWKSGELERWEVGARSEVALWSFVLLCGPLCNSSSIK